MTSHRILTDTGKLHSYGSIRKMTSNTPLTNVMKIDIWK